MGFSRQEYCSGVPFPSPGDLPNPRIKLVSLTPFALADRFFTTRATWEALLSVYEPSNLPPADFSPIRYLYETHVFAVSRIYCHLLLHFPDSHIFHYFLTIVHPEWFQDLILQLFQYPGKLILLLPLWLSW